MMVSGGRPKPPFAGVADANLSPQKQMTITAAIKIARARTGDLQRIGSDWFFYRRFRQDWIASNPQNYWLAYQARRSYLIESSLEVLHGVNAPQYFRPEYRGQRWQWWVQNLQILGQ